MEEIVSCFKRERDSSPEEIRDTLAEIEKFRREAGEKLDEKIYDAYGFDFNPVLWGYTTSSFLDELAKILTT
ncbi:hypothetical protein OKW28_004891 [Paraburkholderia sp. 40]